MQASHILVATLAMATELKERITMGAEFATIAMQYSSCPSKARGGDLGVFGQGQMVKPFEDAVLSAKVGDVTDPVQTQFGFHLIKRTA